MSPRFLGLLILASAPLLGAQSEPTQEPQLGELRQRDARLAFTPESARRARAVLEAASAEERDEVGERAMAMLTLGCGGGAGDAARVEARLESGEGAERSVALFALGELASAGWPSLERALGRDTAGLEDALCVGLALAARRGVRAADERLRVLAAGDGELARRATQALAFLADEDPQGLSETLSLNYVLRWRAAQAFGLVDGRRGVDARRAELFADDRFQDRVVLSAAAVLPAAALRSHLLEMPDLGARPAALGVAALVLPEALAEAVESGGCKPSAEAWRGALSAIDAHRAERRAKDLLGLAFRSSPELEPSAGRLLFRAGGDVSWSWVFDQIEKAEPERRTLLVEACGDRGGEELVPDLEELIQRHEELGLAPTARVALVRLGHEPTKKEVETLLAGEPTPEREQVLAAIARVLHDQSLWRYAEQALKGTDLPAELRLSLQAGLAASGALVDRAELRLAAVGTMGRAQRLAWVGALARQPELADLEALAARFPFEDDLEVDAELALVLLAQRHAAAGGLLTAALWGSDWNRSVLAGGLIVMRAGTRGLLDEIEGAPRTVGERDLRRAGFAIGEWGGLTAVEPLARVRLEGDPVLQGALLGALVNRAESGGEVASPRPRVDLEFTVGGLGGGAGLGGGGGGGASPAPRHKAKGKGKGKKGRNPFGG